MSDPELWPVWRVHADMHGFAAEPNKQVQHKDFIQTYQESADLGCGWECVWSFVSMGELCQELVPLTIQASVKLLIFKA